MTDVHRPVLIAPLTDEYPFGRALRIGYAEGGDPTLRPWIIPALGLASTVPRLLVLGATAGSFLMACHTRWFPDVPEEMRFIDSRAGEQAYWLYLHAPDSSGGHLDLYGLGLDRCDERLVAALALVDGVLLLLDGDAGDVAPLARVAAALRPGTPVAMCGEWPADAARFADAGEYAAAEASVAPAIAALRGRIVRT